MRLEAAGSKSFNIILIYNLSNSIRGWKFTEGIDDMETECGLDKLDHDIVLDNSEGDGTDVIRRLIENTGARNFL